MKAIVTFLTILLSTLSYSQTLLETVILPGGTYWNSGYGMVYSNSKYWISSSSSSAGSGIIKAVDNTSAEVILFKNYKQGKAGFINRHFLFFN